MTSLRAGERSPEDVDRRRRRRLSEGERRAQIVAACIDVLSRDGYDRTTLARVARSARVSKGLISHYFLDRDSLLEHVATATASRLREEVARQLDLFADVPSVIIRALHLAAALGRTHPNELRAVDEIVRNLRAPDGRPRVDLRAYEETLAAQERLFRRGQDEGTLRHFDTRVVAVIYQGAIDTMITYLHSQPDADAEQFATTLSDFVLAAICS